MKIRWLLLEVDIIMIFFDIFEICLLVLGMVKTPFQQSQQQLNWVNDVLDTWWNDKENNIITRHCPAFLLSSSSSTAFFPLSFSLLVLFLTYCGPLHRPFKFPVLKYDGLCSKQNSFQLIFFPQPFIANQLKFSRLHPTEWWKKAETNLHDEERNDRTMRKKGNISERSKTIARRIQHIFTETSLKLQNRVSTIIVSQLFCCAFSV